MIDPSDCIHNLRKQTASDPFDQISGFTGLMGVADTSWVMQREENCVWTLEDEETAEEREIKAVPDYLWKAAEYIESVGNWQGTASELLAAVGIENAKPNQFTYNMAKYFDKVFEAKNIRYKTHGIGRKPRTKRYPKTITYSASRTESLCALAHSHTDSS